jgi:hypothetical protein
MVSKHTLKAAETAVLVARAAATAVEGSEAQSEGACECFGVCCDVDNMNSSQCSICGRFLRKGIRQQNRDVLGRIEAEITEMDAVGFDDTDVILESTDM